MKRKDIAMRGLLLGLLLLSLFAGTAITANAQTPASAGCTVEPRTDEELNVLAATPSVPTTATPEGTPTSLPAGEPVDDEETLAALTDTVNQVAACVRVGDINRLLALYSDQYIVQHIFAREPQPIIPGGPQDGDQTVQATPGAATGPSTVEEATLLPDGRIAARVATGDALDFVYFVESDVDGRWVIDEIHSISSGSDATPEGDLGQYPQPVQVAIIMAAKRLGVPVDELTIDSVEPMNWPDTSLGCPQEGFFYAQVITPGYLVLISANGTQVEFHTNETDHVVFCEEK